MTHGHSRLSSGDCHYCGRVLTKETRTQDHIVPQKLGGTDALVNLVASCAGCNTDKGDSFPTCDCPGCSAAVSYWAGPVDVYPAGVRPEPFAQAIGDLFPALTIKELLTK